MTNPAVPPRLVSEEWAKSISDRAIAQAFPDDDDADIEYVVGFVMGLTTGAVIALALLTWKGLRRKMSISMFDVPATGKPVPEFVETAPGWTKERIELLTLAKAGKWFLHDAMIHPGEVEIAKAYVALVALGCLKERDKYEAGKFVGVEFAITAAGKRELKRVSSIIGEYAS